MACLIALLDYSDKCFQFRQALTNWLLADGLPATTPAKIQGTMRWYDNGSHGLLPPEYWFSNQDIQHLTNADWDVALWNQLGGAHDLEGWSIRGDHSDFQAT